MKTKTGVIIFYICTIINVILVSAFFHQIYLTKELPVIEIKKAGLTCSSTPVERATYGLYSEELNKITITVGQNLSAFYDDEDKLATIYHEYGHYIYAKRLSIQERNEWINKFADQVWVDLELNDFYDDKNKNTETFAREFQTYMIEEGYHFTILKGYENKTELFGFLSNVYSKYVN